MQNQTSALQGTRYRSDSFTKADPSLHHYAMAIHATEYSLMIAHKETGAIQLAYKTADNSGQELAKDLLTKEMSFWQEVNLHSIQGQILHTGSRFTLIPSLVKDEGIISSLFSLNYDLSDHEELHTEPSENPDSTLIYGLDHEIKSYLCDTLPLATHSHIGAALLRLPFSLGNATTLGTSTAVYHTTQNIVVHVAHQGNTALLNSFPCRSQNELAYFLAALAAHPDLRGNGGPMWLMGSINNDDETLINRMKRYLPHLDYATSHQAGLVLPEQERRYFQLLLHQLSCVS